MSCWRFWRMQLVVIVMFNVRSSCSNPCKAFVSLHLDGLPSSALLLHPYSKKEAKACNTFLVSILICCLMLPILVMCYSVLPNLTNTHIIISFRSPLNVLQDRSLALKRNATIHQVFQHTDHSSNRVNNVIKMHEATSSLQYG